MSQQEEDLLTEDLDQDTLSEEVKRRVDYQIETNRWLQEQAAQLLRLFLTVLGLMFTIASFLLSVLSPSSIGSLLTNIRIAQLVEKMAEYSFMSKNLSLLVYFILFCASFYSIFSSAWIFVFVLPENLISILEFDYLRPGIKHEQMKKALEKQRAEYEYRDEYLSLVAENKTVVEDNKKKWNGGHKAIWTSFNRFLLGIIFCSPIYFFREPWAGFSAIVILCFLSINWIIETVGYETLRNHIRVSPIIDTIWIFFTAYATGVLQGLISRNTLANVGFSITSLILMLAIMYASTRLSKDDLLTYVLRTLGISVFTFIIYLVFAINEGVSQGLDSTSVGVQVTASITVTGIFTCGLLIFGRFLIVTIDKLRQGGQKVKAFLG